MAAAISTTYDAPWGTFQRTSSRVPREGERVRIGGVFGSVVLVTWDLDTDAVFIVLRRSFTEVRRSTSIWGAKVQGRCPSCGCHSLFLGSGGYVTCSILSCVAPSAAHDALCREAPDGVTEAELWRRVLEAARSHAWSGWSGTEEAWCAHVVRLLEARDG